MVEINNLQIDVENIFGKYPVESKIGYDFMFLNDTKFLNNDYKDLQTDYYIDIFIQEGSLSCELNSENYYISAPAVLFIPKEKSFNILDYSKDVLVNIFIIRNRLREGLLNEFVKDMSVSNKMKLNPILFVNKEDVSPFIHYVCGVKRIVFDTLNPFRLEAVKHYIESFYYQYFYKIYPFSKSNNFGIVNSFLELVERNFVKEKSVSFYANSLGVSRGYLDFIVKKELETTTKGVIETKIIQECKHLLKNTNESIGNIAKKLGFSSIESFSRFFTRVVGESPSKFKR